MLYLALRSRGYELMPPETMPGIILLGVICLVVAWLIVFTLRLFGAPYRLHVTASEEIKGLKAATQPQSDIADSYPDIRVADSRYIARCYSRTPVSRR